MRRQNRSWTDDEIQKLRDMVAKGASALRTGVVLKRSTHTVKLKALALGIRFPAVQRFSIERILKSPPYPVRSDRVYRQS
jgi:GcrA cell cycle regulator